MSYVLPQLFCCSARTLAVKRLEQRIGMKRLMAITALAAMALLGMAPPANADGSIFCPPSSSSTYIPFDNQVSVQATDLGNQTPLVDLSQPIHLAPVTYSAHAVVQVQQPDGSKVPAVLLCSLPAHEGHNRVLFYAALLIIGMVAALAVLRVTPRRDDRHSNS